MASWLLRLSLILIVAVSGISSVIDTSLRTLMWTEKDLSDGAVNVKGIPGDPEEWVEHGFRQYMMSYFTDPYSRQVSFRVALAFKYSDHTLYFSDRGFKEIFRIVLQTSPTLPFTYNQTLQIVYSGISTRVNGMAVDWASGSIYWTDSQYNWVTVAKASVYAIYKHIVYTGLDRPVGIAVHPKRGLLFWSDNGAVPKIERAKLDGTNRVNFVDNRLSKPLGLCIDYKMDQLYWVDGITDTIERVDVMNPDNRFTITLQSNPTLFGLAVYNDFIFASDQSSLYIKIYNKTTSRFINNINAGLFDNERGIPYDVMMYDSTLQEEINSDCQRLNCSDICISDGGQAAHCICAEGWIMSPDNVNCVEDTGLQEPMYLYSIGESIWGTEVNIADNPDTPTTRCFFNIPRHKMFALGFNAYSHRIFFSDTADRLVHRLNVDTGNITNATVIASNTGLVQGIIVDWIGDNLYWTDTDRGYIMVSRLNGGFTKILMRDLYRPKAIAVNPLNGTLYWSNDDTIFISNMDGSDVQILVSMPGAQFEGMVLDIRRGKLYWTDQSLPGIRSCGMDGSKLQITLQSVDQYFNDVTVYQDYIAWTNGLNGVYFGVKNPDNDSVATIVHGFQHVNANTSHDIITYDTYLQPLPDPATDYQDPCDLDNDQMSCSHLCLLRPFGQRTCACSIGFYLGADGKACLSDRLNDNFLLFIDPYNKAMYQYDLNVTAGDRQPQGVIIRSGNVPSLTAYDLSSQSFYWFDQDTLKNSLKRLNLSDKGIDYSIDTLNKEINVGKIDIASSLNSLLYTDTNAGAIYLLDLSSSDVQKFEYAQNVYGAAATIDDITGSIYWVDDHTRMINVWSCSANATSNVETVFEWNGDPIIGLSVAINDERNLLFWTVNSVFLVNRLSSGYAVPVSIFTGPSDANLTAVVLVDRVVYYADWNSNAIYQYDMATSISTNISDLAFNRLTDLKAYRRRPTDLPSTCQYKSPSTTPPAVVDQASSVLSSEALGGIIGGAIGLLFLLLLLLLIILLLTAWRRKKKLPPPTPPPTIAFMNETYDTMRRSAAFPQGACGVTIFSFFGEKDKDKKGLPFPEISTDDSKIDFEIFGYEEKQKIEETENTCDEATSDEKTEVGNETFSSIQACKDVEEVYLSNQVDENKI